MGLTLGAGDGVGESLSIKKWNNTVDFGVLIYTYYNKIEISLIFFHCRSLIMCFDAL